MINRWYRKGFLLIGMVIVSAVTAEAQLALGVRGGVSVGFPGYSRAYRSIYLDEYDVGFSPGMTFGLVGDTKVGSKFSLQTELNYSLKGVGVKREGGEFVNNTMMLHYIDFPILLKTRLNKGPQKFYLTFGPTISYWLGGNMNIKANELDEWDVERLSLAMTFDPAKQFEDDLIYIPESNRLQFGLSIGGGFENDLRNGQRFMIDVRYDIGHTFLSTVREVDTSLATYQANMETNNQVIAVSVIFVYDLKTLRRNLAK
jgi:hypothetical protein